MSFSGALIWMQTTLPRLDFITGWLILTNDLYISFSSILGQCVDLDPTNIGVETTKAANRSWFLFLKIDVLMLLHAKIWNTQKIAMCWTCFQFMFDLSLGTTIATSAMAAIFRLLRMKYNYNYTNIRKYLSTEQSKCDQMCDAFVVNG